MKTTLTIESEERGERIFVLRLQGQLDGTGAAILMSAWRRTRMTARATVVHLAGVDFISSSGVGALLAILEESRDQDEDVFFVAPSTNVRSVIRLLGLDGFLPLLEDDDSLPMKRAA